MTRRGSALPRVRRNLYQVNRALGGVQAASRGPGPLCEWVLRQVVLRELFRALRRTSNSRN